MKQLKSQLLFILLILINYNVFSKEILCPSHCLCDIFKHYRRATCQNRNLIGVEADVPREVQLLDLSYNLIDELPDRIFINLGLTQLQKLNASHNKINRIHINAFVALDLLKTIDLSHNNIEYLLKNWFWNTPTLHDLYLSGNNFHSLKDEPLIESATIKILDLSGCSLLHLHSSAFMLLPKMEILDISGNYLIQLHVEVLKPLPNLKVLYIKKNNLHCNNVFTNLIQYCRKNDISVTDVCLKSSHKPIQKMFEKLIGNSEAPIQNGWIYEEATTVSHTTMCNYKQPSKEIISSIIEIFPVFILVSTFFVGLGTGLCIGCGITSLLNRNSSKRLRTKCLYLPLADQFNTSYSTPIAMRRLTK